VSREIAPTHGLVQPLPHPHTHERNLLRVIFGTAGAATRGRCVGVYKDRAAGRAPEVHAP
jgi:hypothetical protein